MRHYGASIIDITVLNSLKTYDNYLSHCLNVTLLYLTHDWRSQEPLITWLKDTIGISSVTLRMHMHMPAAPHWIEAGIPCNYNTIWFCGLLKRQKVSQRSVSKSAHRGRTTAVCLEPVAAEDRTVETIRVKVLMTGWNMFSRKPQLIQMYECE